MPLAACSAWPFVQPMDDAALHAALLQSLPGHGGYNPQSARDALVQLASSTQVSPDVAQLARLRLAELGVADGCRAEVQELHQRLARVVDIEKRTGH